MISFSISFIYNKKEVKKMTKSIRNITFHEIIIKKSRFITGLYPCLNIEQAKLYLGQHQQHYPDASHHCYAYIIGPQERANDNGEPSQTAGMPMLNVLKRQGLDNILAITTRYFGGIKLGAGGLVRAYSDSVAKALLEADIIETVPVALYEIRFDYTFSKKIDYFFQHEPSILVKDKLYEDQVIYQCYIKDEQVFSQIQEMTNNLYFKKKLRIDLIEK